MPVPRLHVGLMGSMALLVLLATGQVFAQSYREMVEADWLRQAESAQAPVGRKRFPRPSSSPGRGSWRPI